MTKLQYLGQNGFKLSFDSVVMYFDLYLSNCVYELTGSGERSYPSPVNANDITDADLYLISHEHLDHLDPETVRTVADASPNSMFICPAPHTNMLEEMGIDSSRIIGARAYEKISVNGVEISPIPEKHEQYFN